MCALACGGLLRNYQDAVRSDLYVAGGALEPAGGLGAQGAGLDVCLETRTHKSLILSFTHE